MAIGAVILSLMYVLRAWFGLDVAKKNHLIYTEISIFLKMFYCNFFVEFINYLNVLFTVFTNQEFDEAIKIVVPISIVIGVSSFVLTALSAIYAIAFQSKSSLMDFLKSALQFGTYFFIIAFLFGISLVFLHCILCLLIILRYFLLMKRYFYYRFLFPYSIMVLALTCLLFFFAGMNNSITNIIYPVTISF